VIGPGAFAKKGAASCGVKRQWCGRPGKVGNCQAGVFLCYAAKGGYAPLDRRLYLPDDWAADAGRRKKCRVPAGVTFEEKWRIGPGMVDRCRAGGLPHGWVAADDEFGRASEFRAGLRGRGERYVLDVPGNTLVRDVEARRPPRKRGPAGAASGPSRSRACGTGPPDSRPRHGGRWRCGTGPRGRWRSRP